MTFKALLHGDRVHVQMQSLNGTHMHDPSHASSSPLRFKIGHFATREQITLHHAIAATHGCSHLLQLDSLAHSHRNHFLQELAYQATGGDEVEDLVALLAYAQQQLPGLEAVASGAIASDYQRTRVENVSPACA